MFGWEFPPNCIGGLGRVCYNLVKNLSKKNVNVIFVMPKGSSNSKFGKIISLDDPFVEIKSVKSPLVCYMTPEQYQQEILIPSPKKPGIYGRNLFEEVENYTKKAERIIKRENYDIIHVHDWMTFKAGIAAKKLSGKPLIVHVHSTEFDRSGDDVNQAVYDIEREGMHSADSIIAVSNYTKNKIIKHYGISEKRIHVVYNGIESVYNSLIDKINKNDKIVLFFGRITFQKGPDYFLAVAKKLLAHNQNIKFVIAGSGDMEHYLIEKAAEMGISDRVIFTGFLQEEDVNRIYQYADVYILPSVSEPFGITALEAMNNGVPVVISKNSGVTEVVKHCLKVDFWDIDEICNKTLALLNHDALHTCIREEGFQEVSRITWEESTNKCIDVYKNSLGGL